MFVFSEIYSHDECSDATLLVYPVDAFGFFFLNMVPGPPKVNGNQVGQEVDILICRKQIIRKSNKHKIVIKYNAQSPKNYNTISDN